MRPPGKGLPSLEKRRYRREPGNAYKYPKGGSKEVSARLFLVVPSDKTGGNRHKMKHRRFHLQLHTRKHFFTMKVFKHWHRLPRGVSILGVIQNPHGEGPEQPAGLRDLTLGRGLDYTIARGPFPSQPSYDKKSNTTLKIIHNQWFCSVHCTCTADLQQLLS